jgi:hypothetical protein
MEIEIKINNEIRPYDQNEILFVLMEHTIDTYFVNNYLTHILGN